VSSSAFERSFEAIGSHPSNSSPNTAHAAATLNDEKMLEPLRTLRAKGVGIAFDDFGTGYASLSHLTRYPLTRIKIDRSFVRKITDASALHETAIVENLAPVIFRSKRLDENSGGTGQEQVAWGFVSFGSRWPGTIRTSLLTERVRVAPRGWLGGSPGKPGHVYHNGSPVENPKGVLSLNLGDILKLGLPGGGGFGKV
jgi:EAL domain-containing protein/hydantoinase/oxoprolinase-like protein